MSENKIKFPVKLASNNPQSFGIADATEISGHRTVDTLSDLYAISDPVLSILKDGSDAIGQEWFVVSEDCKYRLDNWESRKSASGWTKLPKQELINTKQSVSEKDQPNGYAGLDSNGKLPIEKTYGTTATVVDVATYEELPVTGLSGVIYYVASTSAQYKWSGSSYIDITDGADNAKKNETSIFDCSNGTSTQYYSSLSAAINVVPPEYRTSNRIISYLSTENSPTSAVNYQYHGIDSTTWTDLTKWERIPNQADLADIRSDLNEKIEKNAIKQITGSSETEVMSQKAVTENLGSINLPFSINGYGITSVGEILASEVEKITETSYIKGAKKIIVTSSYPNTNVVFLDENKVKISISSGVKNMSLLDIPANTEYVVVGDKIGATNSLAVVLYDENLILNSLDKRIRSVQSQTNNNNNNISNNTNNISNFKKLLGTDLVITDITISPALTGKSVNMDGVIINAYRTNISTSIQVLKGEILFLYTDSTNASSGICRTDANGSFYQRINTSEGSVRQWFSYSCNKDEYLSVIYYADYANTKCFKMNSTTLSEFKDSIFAEINYPLDKRMTNIEGLIDNSFIYNKLITKSYQELKGEINSNGIVVTPSSSYKYTTPIQVFKNDILNVVDVRGSNIALISLTDETGSFHTPIKLSTGSTLSFNHMVEEDGYIALSYVPTATTKIEFYQIVNIEELLKIIDSMIKQNDAENSGFVSPYKNAPLLSFSQCSENKLYGMEFSLTKNPCSQDGILPICTMISGTSTYQLQYTLAKPTSALNAPQKEWTTADYSSSTLSIYFPDFPMAQLINELQLIKDGSLLSKIVLSGKPYRSLVNQNPIITVRYLKKETDVLSEMTDLRLFVNETDGICNQILIKKGDTIIWQYDIAVDADMYNVYNDMKTQLSDVSGYNFDIVFSNIEYITIADLVPTKPEGLGFVTALSNDALTTGAIVYDTIPVFIEAADKTNHTINIKVGEAITYIEYDGLNVFSFAKKCDSLSFDKNDKNIIKVENTDSYYYAPTPMVKIYQAHSLLNMPLPPDSEQPTYPSLHNPIGASLRVSRLLKSKGYESISFRDVVEYLINGKQLPPKSYIIELDDFILLDGFKKLFSNTDLDGLRMMEMLKQEGLKMSFAMEFWPERTLMEKIENGTATEEEKNILSAQMTNEKVIKIRAMMRSYDWHIAIHGFVISCNLTTTTFDNFVNAVRKTISWYERMFEQSPYSYVVSGTGNSSPYYRRLLPMYGLPIFVQDEYKIANQNLSSCSKLVPYIARIPFYNRTVIDSHGKDIDFD